jgi:hypothetical protein
VYISVVKPGVDRKKFPPLPYKSFSSKYIYFHLRDLRELIVFALDNAFYSLGVHILKQLVGLTMGDPFSPPLAILYVAVDEHKFTLPRSLQPSNDLQLLIYRYVDDMQCLIGTRHNHNTLLNTLIHNITNQVYEADQDTKSLTIIQTHDNKFLHSNFLINTNTIKMIFHNKNENIFDTHIQEVGRFASFHDHTSFSAKQSALLALFILVHDYTTHYHDMLIPLLQIAFEATLLSFPIHAILSTIIKANRSRPAPIWATFTHALSHTQK